jgi:hypothetical protein
MVILLLGCSTHVPVEKVYGSYVASFRYGTETLMLNRDGTFVQTVVVNREKPVAALGSWEFDRDESRLTLHGAMVVDDGLGNLRNNWQRPVSGLVAPSVEMDWFRVVIASGDAYRYQKR